MKTIIFILIAVGLLWNSYSSSLNSFDSKSENIISFDSKIGEELTEERTSESQDDEREFYKLHYLTLNNISKKLFMLRLKNKVTESPVLLGFISPVFTPPPNLV